MLSDQTKAGRRWFLYHGPIIYAHIYNELLEERRVMAVAIFNRAIVVRVSKMR